MMTKSMITILNLRRKDRKMNQKKKEKIKLMGRLIISQKNKMHNRIIKIRNLNLRTSKVQRMQTCRMYRKMNLTLTNSKRI